jgi:hypothetical protein
MEKGQKNQILRDLEERKNELEKILGTPLINKITTIEDKCKGKGIAGGMITGALFGGYLGSQLEGADGTTFEGIVLLAFFGATILGNFGAIAGIKYGEYKLKRLQKEHSDKAEQIKEYNKIHTTQYALWMRSAPM